MIRPLFRAMKKPVCRQAGNLFLYLKIASYLPMTYWDKGKKKHNKWQKSRDQPVLNLIQGSGVCMSFAPSLPRNGRSRHTRLPARQEAGNIDLYYFAETSSHIVRYVKMF
jgi:hypothetical protein